MIKLYIATTTKAKIKKKKKKKGGRKYQERESLREGLKLFLSARKDDLLPTATCINS